MSIINFDNVYIECSSSLVGKKEFEGPLGDRFDAYEKDEYFGCKNFEEAESEMIRRNLNILMSKTNKDFDEIDLLLGGDLINQCIATSFGIKDTKIPYIGLYGACSTIIEGLICGSAFVNNNYAKNAICVSSSHFCSAERQYRFPLEYGSIRTPTSQNTVTGSGAFLLTNERRKIKIKSAIIGRIIDKNVTDANNMGAAMACAAVDTIKRFFADYNISPNEIDVIVSGDLGKEGHEIALDMLNLEYCPISNNFTDCGMLIYNSDIQDTHCGGSGCGCIASVLGGHFIKLLEDNVIKNCLAIGTGALLNPNSVFQGRHIPAIAHAIYITSED